MLFAFDAVYKTERSRFCRANTVGWIAMIRGVVQSIVMGSSGSTHAMMGERNSPETPKTRSRRLIRLGSSKNNRGTQKTVDMASGSLPLTEEMVSSALTVRSRASSTHFPAVVEDDHVVTLQPPYAQNKAPLSYRIQMNDQQDLGYMSIQFDSLQEALDNAAETGMPVLCLRTEQPGDIDSGRDIFSHPLIVEAAESLFVTVQPKKTASGDSSASKVPSGDEHIRSCSCTVDFRDYSGAEVVPSLCSRRLTRAGMVHAMIDALETCHRPVPKYLQLLREEEAGHIGPKSMVHQSVFGVADLAEGEVEFAGLDGVLATKAGYIDRRRVIEVTFDSRRLSYCCLVRFAVRRNLAGQIFYKTNEERIAALVEVQRVQEQSETVEYSGSIQPDYDPKSALRKTPLRYVPLTELQVTRANRLVHLGLFNEAVHLLSPRQGLILMQAMKVASQKSFHEVVDVPILAAWISVCEKQHPKRTLEAMEERRGAQSDEYYYH